MSLVVPVFSLARAYEFETRNVNPFELDAPELVELIQAKEPRTIGHWRELGGEEYARAFTAAQTVGYDIVRDLHRAFLDVLATPGATGEDFVRVVLPTLRKSGWLADKSDDQVATRLRLIYDTNLRTGQAVGRCNRIQRTKAALPYLYSFTAGDRRVRHPPKSEEDHRAFEGILLPVDHPFWQQYFPPLGFRCFLPQTRIEGAVKAGVRRWHDGKAVEVRSASGANLSVTPDHPILTGRGWVLAKHIRKGDRLLRRPRVIDAEATAIQHDEQLPPRADELFDALAAHTFAIRKPAPLQLNRKANGRDGEIDVVFADRELAEEVRTEIGRELVLEGANLAVDTTGGRLGAMLDGERKAEAGNAGQSGDFALRASETVGHSSHGNFGVLRKLLAKLGFERIVPSASDHPGAPALPLDATKRLFDGLPLDQFRLGTASNDDALFDELALNDGAGDAGLFGYLLDTHSDQIVEDEVVEVRQFDFAGHVYDFQTEESILSADSLVVHNCRCQVVQRSRSQAARLGPVTTEAELAERRSRLGRPWGFNPGANPLAGVNAAADRANAERLEGAPVISPQANRQRAGTMFDLIASKALSEAVEDLLAQIFKR